MSCIEVSVVPEGGNDINNKTYDYLLKFLLVGDSDVGKHEILHELEDGSVESPFCVGNGNYILSIKPYLGYRYYDKRWFRINEYANNK